jgi:DNA-binding NarL/FixJ family response regulator
MIEILPVSSVRTLRVLIVADDSLARIGLSAVLDRDPDCDVVGQIGPDDDVTSMAERSQPDVILWDAGADPALPLDLVEMMEEGSPVLVLVSGEAAAAAAYASGVRGLLPRDADASSLLAALRARAGGLAVFYPAFVPRGVPPRDRAALAPIEELTVREMEVLQLLAAGLANKAIAERLAVSEHTVKFHVNAILGKLGAHSRTEAVTRAARLGLIIL